MADDKTLALYLDGPMQSWGYQSRFNRRTSLSYPTKSGIMGILCAALGIPKYETEMLTALAALHCEIVSFSQSGRWIDYHTVGGGYEPGSPHIPRIASGKRAKDAAITFREYLSDAKFGVLLSGDPAFLERCDAALRNPTWGIWLGRKCCIPASPVAQGLFSDREKALERLRAIAERPEVRTITDVENFHEGTDSLPDIPLDFSKRDFTMRRVCVEDVQQQEI